MLSSINKNSWGYEISDHKIFDMDNSRFIRSLAIMPWITDILWEAVINDQADDDFQFVITLFAQDLLAIDSNINDCNSPNNYTMFLPSDNVPSAAVSQLVGLTGDIADYLSYYVYPDDLTLEPNQNLTLQMLDGNEAIVSTTNEPPTVNNIDISGVLCACNGLIYLIDDLIWAPGVINIDENIDDYKVLLGKENRDMTDVELLNRDYVLFLKLENIPHDKVVYYYNASNLMVLTSFHEGSPARNADALVSEQWL